MYTAQLKDNQTQIVIKERYFNNYNDAFRMVTGLANKWNLAKSADGCNMFENSEICLNITQK